MEGLVWLASTYILWRIVHFNHSLPSQFVGPEKKGSSTPLPLSKRVQDSRHAILPIKCCLVGSVQNSSSFENSAVSLGSSHALNRRSSLSHETDASHHDHNILKPASFRHCIVLGLHRLDS